MLSDVIELLLIKTLRGINLNVTFNHRHPTTRLRTLSQAAEKIFVNVYRHGVIWPETHKKQSFCQNNTISLKNVKLFMLKIRICKSKSYNKIFK